eukprot:4696529-Prymnesium_polylepis.2
MPEASPPLEHVAGGAAAGGGDVTGGPGRRSCEDQISSVTTGMALHRSVRLPRADGRAYGPPARRTSGDRPPVSHDLRVE